MNKNDYVIWRLPKEAAHTILETLALDSQSPAFDPELRKEIGEAMDSIKDVSELLPALKQLKHAVHEHRLLDVKKRFSLCTADAQAGTAIAKAESKP